MAQSYLQSKQAGAYSSLNSLMDIQAKLDAKQQEYEQRKEAQKEINKANTRSLGAQGALMYGIYNYPEISSGLSNLFTDSAATQTTPAEFGIGFNQGGQPVTVAPPNQLIQLPGAPEAGASTVAATPVTPIAPSVTPAVVPTATPAIAPSAIPTASATPAIVPAASTVAPATTAVTPAIQTGTNAAAATSTGVSTIAPNTASATPAAGSTGSVGGAMSGAMVGAGSALGIGMGAYDMSQNGVTVGNASSVIGGTIMASSFAFPPAAPVLVPVGATIMIGGNILSAVFGW